ncbi:MAG: acetate kinase [Spirochaetes bacterium]|nr:acetate kinase [Spirochaetota bacterium]MBN2771565.1 acetate kinase [Spirochaetota bacterium]
MIILVINCGSSSIKFQLFDMPTKKDMAKGLIERIGEDDAKITYKYNGEKHVEVLPIKDHKAGLAKLAQMITDEKTGVISSLSEIEAVGHRVVHGGECYNSSVLIDETVIKGIDECAELAPLHNPPNLMGINEAMSMFPGAKNVAVFDTAFHQTIPDYAFTYPLPHKYYEDYKVRRYGFHGTSHAYVTERSAELLGKPVDQVNLITCHLGNGCSITAVKNGKSVDTSMGLTPLEGLVMGTRSGDIDPAILFYLAKKENLKMEDFDRILNKESGLLGISGISNDQRNLEDLQDTNERAKLALDIFDYKLKKYIGSYMAVLNDVDAIVFTGGIGENGSLTRGKSCSGLEALGVQIDDRKNEETIRGKEGEISKPSSKVKILVVPTDEEGRIASDTYQLVK